ncbi:hypothetical protein X801_02084 [Opisthorchis viverrini]|uniref:Neurotransmitter-gated ion-channel ligand-binding domain-containing protein n=1 Tax=Opisthorchis viverrini TaxID=6198 RepID=A0A1S8X5S0_OPIVI|nr:hypothetical protein X801_02084 [Opisthorchis viverrini]
MKIGVLTLSDEKRLIKRLLKNYEDAGITGRPVINTEEVVKINMSLSLIQILDLDEKNQVLTIRILSTNNLKEEIRTEEEPMISYIDGYCINISAGFLCSGVFLIPKEYWQPMRKICASDY